MPIDLWFIFWIIRTISKGWLKLKNSHTDGLWLLLTFKKMSNFWTYFVVKIIQIRNFRSTIEAFEYFVWEIFFRSHRFHFYKFEPAKQRKKFKKIGENQNQTTDWTNKKPKQIFLIKLQQRNKTRPCDSVPRTWLNSVNRSR